MVSKTPGVLENLRFWEKRLLLLGDGLLDNLLHDLLGGLGLLGGGLLLQMTARYAIATALLRTHVRKVRLQHRKRDETFTDDGTQRHSHCVVKNAGSKSDTPTQKKSLG